MRVPLSSVVAFLRSQALYLAISAVAGAVFWANGQRINPFTVIVYSVCIGNLVTFATKYLHPLYSERPLPYNWLLFLPILFLLLTPVYVMSSVIVWWLAPPTPQTLGHLLRTGWKFPFLITFVFSVLIFLYESSKERLQRRNQELQCSVELGSARLAMQEQEFERAREIQQSLLPREIPQLAGFDVAGAWEPARSVGGDYYDVLRLGDHRLGICIADVVGKGVSAALLMANMQAAVRAFASEQESPAGVCAKVNSLLHENIATGKFVTFLYGILDAEAYTFQFCNAGHLDPILVTAGPVPKMEPGGAVLGVFPSWHYENATIELRKGDRLLLFTDGITEAENAVGREFEEAGVAAFARANNALSARELNSRLLAQVTTFCSGHFQDDATLLVVGAK